MNIKNFFCLIAALLIGANINAQTPVPGGDVSGTWTLSGSPYQIQGEITIPDNLTLTIEAGVIIIFQGSYTMWIEGQVLAQGTESDSIKFTAEDIVTGWNSICFDDTDPANDTSRFDHCIFEYGKAHGPFPYNSGGAIKAVGFSKIVFDHCLFQYNEALDTMLYSWPTGGAISLGIGSSPVIQNNKFINNTSLFGGAIFCTENDTKIVNNEFSYNSALDYDPFMVGYGYGGAITAYLNSSPEIGNNIFHHNYAERGGGAIALIDKCDAYVHHNLIYSNVADWIGGGIEVQDTCRPLIVNNTVAGNHSNQYGGGIDFWSADSSTIMNTILWGNTATLEGDQIYLKDEQSYPGFWYSDIQGGQSAFGGFTHTGLYEECFDKDPMFENPQAGNYHLTYGSPCINTGDTSMLDPDGTRCDIGAFYYHLYVGISDQKVGEQTIMVQCYPNPAADAALLRLTINGYRLTICDLYSIDGRKIRELKRQEMPAGEHEVEIDVSDLPDGLYFLRVQTGSEVAVAKLLVVH